MKSDLAQFKTSVTDSHRTLSKASHQKGCLAAAAFHDPKLKDG